MLNENNKPSLVGEGFCYWKVRITNPRYWADDYFKIRFWFLALYKYEKGLSLNLTRFSFR